MKIGNVKVSGFMEMFVTNKITGIKKRVYAGNNTIHATFFKTMGDLMVTNYDYSSAGKLFTVNEYPPDIAKHGICFKDTTLPAPTSINFLTVSRYRSMKTTITQPAVNKLTATGLWDAATEVYVTAPVWGGAWTPQGSSDYYPMVPYATNPSFTPQTVIAANAITIVWTITFTVV